MNAVSQSWESLVVRYCLGRNTGRGFVHRNGFFRRKLNAGANQFHARGTCSGMLVTDGEDPRGDGRRQ